MLRLHYCRTHVKELTSGVDALYLSARCDLPAALIARLDMARQSATDSEGPVPFAFGGYDWEMQTHGLGRYHFRLDHPLAIVGVTVSEKLPTFRVQTRAEALHSNMGPRGVVRWITSALHNEALPANWTVSRLDLHADTQGWNPTGNDRYRFVCRARKLATYEDDGALSGFTFGNRSTKTVNGRIYDKTREIAGNGHDWWLAIWSDRYDPEQPVWRTEFEVHRAALKEMSLSDPDDVLDAVDRIWSYVTNDWLTYRRPSGHERPARWPLSNEWERIQRVSLAGNALPMERIRSGRAAGGLRTAMPGINGYVATFESWTGLASIDDACAALPDYLRAYEATSGQSFADRVAEKRRKHQ
jgi:hypothetical protein